MRRISIIDMGTNTFNLLVAEAAGQGTPRILHTGTLPVSLGQGGLTRGVISPEAYHRGLQAFERHLEAARRHGATEVYAVATAAIRQARNGRRLAQEISRRYGVRVDVITGQREAELIYLGVRQSLDIGPEAAMIVDIGGGSTEIVIANGSQRLWSRSYSLGVSRLLEQFAPSSPIAPGEILAIERHLAYSLRDLRAPIRAHRPGTLIGSAGAFDTYRSLLEESGEVPRSDAPSMALPMAAYLRLHQQLLQLPGRQQEALRGMESMRGELVALASLLTHFVIQRFGISRLLHSAYALREGALWSVHRGHALATSGEL